MVNDSEKMYCYDETVAKKWQNDVASLLFQFLKSHEVTTKKIILLSVGSAGQNKNIFLCVFVRVS